MYYITNNIIFKGVIVVIEISIPYRLPQSKNKYIILGEVDPERMVLPVVIDMSELKEIINKLCAPFIFGNIIELEYSEKKGAPCIKFKVVEPKGESNAPV